MTGAMYAAVAGLRAHMSALNVIGQNISNVNTNAYKATRYTFLEALYTTVRGGSNGSNLVGGKNPAQNGYGSSIGTIDLDMSTKNYTPTGQALDVMIDGDGFLIVGDKTSTFMNGADDLKGMNLTRLGNLSFDPNGYLVDGQGQVVYGYLSVLSPLYEAAVKQGNALGNVGAPDPDNPPNKGVAGLPTLADVIKEGAADATKGPKDLNFYIDDKGQVVQAREVKAADGTNPAEFEYFVVEQYTSAPVLTAIRSPKADADGKAVYPSWDKDPTSETYGQILDGEGTSRIVRESVSIDENTGRITCTTNTGEAVVIGTIAIAKVENPNGVTHVDGHYYQALEGAGEVRATSVGHSVKNSNHEDSPFNVKFIPTVDDTTGAITAPADTTQATMGPGEFSVQPSGGTKLLGGGLESSGTDLANEISNMIMIQRGYQANTRIVTVTDTMLEELVNMKR